MFEKKTKHDMKQKNGKKIFEKKFELFDCFELINKFLISITFCAFINIERELEVNRNLDKVKGWSKLWTI